MRVWWPHAVLAGSLLCMRGGLPAEPQSVRSGEVELSRQVEACIRLAQHYLASQQRPEGSFAGNQGEGTGVVAAGVLAWMVSGNLPGQGPYGRQVARGLDFLLDSAQPSGLILSGTGDHHAMYHHGLAVLCLAESYGQTQDRRVYEKLRKAVDLIVHAQNDAGGWRYQPQPDPRGDLSVTVMQLNALRAARDAGLAVPGESIRRAVEYVESCAVKNPSGEARAFAYQPRGDVRWSTTASGVMSLMLCGQYRIERVKPALEELIRVRSKGEDRRDWFVYGAYYAAQALYQAAGQSDEFKGAWVGWYHSLAQVLMKEQLASGGDKGRFQIDGQYGVWSTAMCVLILGLPYRYLPIYQR